MNPLSYFYTIRSYVDAYAGFLGRRFLSRHLGRRDLRRHLVLRLSARLWRLQAAGKPRNRLIVIAVVLVAWIALYGVHDHPRPPPGQGAGRQSRK